MIFNTTSLVLSLFASKCTSLSNCTSFGVVTLKFGDVLGSQKYCSQIFFLTIKHTHFIQCVKSPSKKYEHIWLKLRDKLHTTLRKQAANTTATYFLVHVYLTE